VYYGTRLSAAGWGNELSVLGVPMTLQYLGMPVGCAAMLVFVCRDLARSARGLPRLSIPDPLAAGAEDRAVEPPLSGASR
jgi:TRAP-type C4-dicarboxylate transport system permease small subunit